MSEHRRKPPQGRGRRAAQQPPSGRRAAPPPSAAPGPAGPPAERPPGGRAESRRAAAGGRRRAANASASAGGAGAGHGGSGGGRRGYGGDGPPGGRGRGRPQPPAKKRFIDYPRSGKYGVKRWMPSWKQVLGTFVGFLGLLMGLAGIAYAMVEKPNPNETAQSEKNVYYWADKEEMVTAGGGDQNRQIVDLAKIPKSMQNAVISAENESFYEDPGIDPMGIARAMFNMATGGATQSGSTITQQYVKNTYLDQSQTLERKAKELLISIKVGANEDKDDILAGYLNTAYYGRGAYGIQAAAQAYYDKNSEDLNPSESAFLSATLNGPNLYDPFGGDGGGAAQSAEANTIRAKDRWKWTLDREVETGLMDQSTRDKWVQKGFPKPNPPEKSTYLKGQIGYLVNLANSDLTGDPNSGITNEELKRGGYQIYTTFDRKKTQSLEETVKKVKKENLDPKKRDEDKYVQFGGASVKPGDGAVQAIYGGESAVTHYMNNAAYTGASVGSTFKPYVMAAAMRDGVRDPDGPPTQGPDTRTPLSPKSKYDGDNKIKLLEYNGDTWLNKDGEEWHQKNEGGDSYDDVTLKYAMQVSANTPFIQLGMDVGLKKVKESALDAGLKDDKSLAALTPTFSLGTSAPSAIRMATGYATFADSGLKTDPYMVTSAKKRGETVYEHETSTEQAFESKVADNVTAMLENVVQKGTGTTAKALGRPAAGKTGTTDDNKQAWFTGYTPQLSTSIGMWRMDDSENPEKRGFLSMYGTAGRDQIHGASFPAEVWTDYMRAALKGEKKVPFPEPGPIGEEVCSHTSCPDPSPSPSTTPSDEPSEEPTETMTPTPTAPTSPSPTKSCRWGWDCEEDGGTTAGNGGETGSTENGGTDAGTDQGTTDGGTTEGDPGGDDGGLLGGSRGRQEE